MDDEMAGTWKEKVVAYLRYYPGISLEGLRKIMRNISRYSRSPGLDLNPGTLEKGIGVSITVPNLRLTGNGGVYGKHNRFTVNVTSNCRNDLVMRHKINLLCRFLL
jgi:hypothetical protein